MIGILDCGTTNTKCYIVNTKGAFIAERYGAFGVKDNALDACRNDYKKNLRALIEETAQQCGKTINDITHVIGFGMISSDLGLLVVPHAETPTSIKMQQAGISIVNDESIFGKDITFILIRGIKNALQKQKSISNLDICDFMRGEETQVAGIFESYNHTEDFCVVIFGSHLKIIHVQKDGTITQSMTTMSGQIFDCLINNTVIGKSVSFANEEARTLSDSEIIALAKENDQGLMRGLLLPRFMEAFTDLSKSDALAYVDALIAIEDIKALKEYMSGGCYTTNKYFFVGQKSRCEMFAQVVTSFGNNKEIIIIDGKEKNRDISIAGVKKIVENIFIGENDEV